MEISPEKTEIPDRHSPFQKQHLTPYKVDGSTNKENLQVTSENTAIVFLFGDRAYTEIPERQQLLLGALKSLRNPNFGAWRGPILVVTDQPKLVQRLLSANASLLSLTDTCHDPNPDTPYAPTPNPLGLSVHRARGIPFHSMNYKVVKTDIPSILENENHLRQNMDLPALQYALYVDVDIFTLCPVKKFIDYLAIHYRGEELACFEQPKIRGQILHGGIWLAHINRSRRFLAQWRSEMNRCQWKRITWDQVALARVIHRRGGPSVIPNIVHLLPFGDLYPYMLDNESEWRRGIFIHLNRRLQAGTPDQAVHLWFIRELGIDSFQLVPPTFVSKIFLSPLSTIVAFFENIYRFYILKICSKLLPVTKKFLKFKR